jgi:hypothetical protein
VPYPSFSGAATGQFQPKQLWDGGSRGEPLSYRPTTLGPASEVGPILSSFKESRSFDLELARAPDGCQLLRTARKLLREDRNGMRPALAGKALFVSGDFLHG